MTPKGTVPPLSLFRFNKLGLDRIVGTDEPLPQDQVEEVQTFCPIQSAPLNVEKIVYIDIGTSHSAAVTGETVLLCDQVLNWDL